MATHTVTGMRRFKGDVEGQHHDFTKLRVQFKAATKNKENELGYGELEMKIGDHTEFDKLKHLPFPLPFELEIENTTKGMEIVSFKPMAPAKAA